jgi:hypothetical protein
MENPSSPSRFDMFSPSVTTTSYSTTVYITNLFIVFLIIFCTWFIILQTFNPIIVKYKEPGSIEPLEDANPDLTKCFAYSLGLTFVIILIIWMFKSCK